MAAGRVEADRSGRAPGRGAYLCRDAACWQAARKRRSLDRALHYQIPAEDWIRLERGILEKAEADGRTL